MREGQKEEENKVEEKRRQRGTEEIIDEDEAPQVVIEEKDKDRIAEDEAKAFVAENEGVTKIDKSEKVLPKTDVPTRPKKENTRIGMKKAKRLNEGLKRIIDDEKDIVEKSKKSGAKKEKRLKLSFEEDE